MKICLKKIAHIHTHTEVLFKMFEIAFTVIIATCFQFLLSIFWSLNLVQKDLEFLFIKKCVLSLEQDKTSSTASPWNFHWGTPFGSEGIFWWFDCSFACFFTDLDIDCNKPGSRIKMRWLTYLLQMQEKEPSKTKESR